MKQLSNRQRSRRISGKQNGFSLIELMMSLGILGIVMTGFATYVTSATRAQKAITIKMDQVDFKNFVTSQNSGLTIPSKCSADLGTLPNPTSWSTTPKANLDSSVAKINEYKSDGTLIGEIANAATGVINGSSLLKLNSISIDKLNRLVLPVAPATTGSAQVILELNVQPADSSMAAIRSLKFPMNVTIDAGGVMTSCQVLSPMDSTSLASQTPQVPYTETFIQDSTWVVPDGVTKVSYTVIGGGGGATVGAAQSSNQAYRMGGPGGGGASCFGTKKANGGAGANFNVISQGCTNTIGANGEVIRGTYEVTPGDTITVNVGGGGGSAGYNSGGGGYGGGGGGAGYPYVAGVGGTTCGAPGSNGNGSSNLGARGGSLNFGGLVPNGNGGRDSGGGASGGAGGNINIIYTPRQSIENRATYQMSSENGQDMGGSLFTSMGQGGKTSGVYLQHESGSAPIDYCKTSATGGQPGSVTISYLK